MSETQNSRWPLIAYVLAAVALFFFLASLVGDGTGLFHSGLMMSAMWIWPVLLLGFGLLVGYFVGTADRAQE